jgi:hypothetical protein
MTALHRIEGLGAVNCTALPMIEEVEVDFHVEHSPGHEVQKNWVSRATHIAFLLISYIYFILSFSSL